MLRQRAGRRWLMRENPKPMKSGLDPLLAAQIDAALWCEAVKHQAEVVAQCRRALGGALTALDNVAFRADQALSDVRAIETIRTGNKS